MICCKEREKNNHFRKLCMQWAELPADVRTTQPQPTYFFLFFSDKHLIYGETE